MIGLSFHDQDLFSQADRANAPQDPPAVGYRAEESWINTITRQEWDWIHQMADARAEREFSTYRTTEESYL